ncbi:MAG: hypothetical protein F4Z32_00645 [Gemmatimonadetes bacterium]|nr:hypothetical protein [Gemmatimonadota bacterium]
MPWPRARSPMSRSAGPSSSRCAGPTGSAGSPAACTGKSRRYVAWCTPGAGKAATPTIEFEPESAGRTRLTLTHARFTQDEARDEHERSWADCLEKLRELCAA